MEIDEFSKLEKEINELEIQKVKEDELNKLKKKKIELQEEITVIKSTGISRTQSESVSIAEIALFIVSVLLSGALIAEHSRLALIPLIATVVLIFGFVAKRNKI